MTAVALASHAHDMHHDFVHHSTLHADLRQHRRRASWAHFQPPISADKSNNANETKHKSRNPRSANQPDHMKLVSAVQARTVSEFQALLHSHKLSHNHNLANPNLKSNSTDDVSPYGRTIMATTSTIQLALFPVILWPFVVIFNTAMEIFSVCVVLIKSVQLPHEHVEVFMQASSASSQSDGTSCNNLAKVESLASHVAHLRSIVDAERTARIQISQVHSKTQILVEEQRDEIAKLEGMNESLKDEVERLTARLIEALFDKSHNPLLSISSGAGSDEDATVLNAQHQSTSSPLMQFKLRLDDDVDGFKFDGPVFEKKEDSFTDEESDDDNAVADDDESDSVFDEDNQVQLYVAAKTEQADSFASVTEEDEDDENEQIEEKEGYGPLIPPVFKNSAELLSLATQNLLQSLTSNASPNSLPIQLDNLAATLPLTQSLCAQAAIASLLSFMSVTASKSAAPLDLANTARTLFRKHLVLLQIHCTGPSVQTRLTLLETLADYCHNYAKPRNCFNFGKQMPDLPWQAAFGMLVYVLVDLEIVEAADVVGWWAGKKGREDEEGVYLACMEYMDKLCKTLEPYCFDDSDEEEEEDEEEEDEDDADCDDNESEEGDDVEEEVVWDDDDFLEEDRSLFVDDGFIASVSLEEERDQVYSADEKERRVSFKV
ncbi:hypothetical protein HK100_005369 [Physocladia obscura]|uniref:W2 domain-containing protein n=1 Tax=Physocladia obscura TaxID=109957 RepID=A0AAD5SXF2_9FUNG|nr:hypothetical protein HK100_005369 [Physocladia obscura]